MRISTKGRYGLRAIIDLAIHSTKEHVSLKHIAERQNISEAYLEQMFASMRKAGLVKSIKGPQGGYYIGEKLENITVGQVLRVLEGDMNVIDQDTMIQKEEKSIEYCIQKNVWEQMNMCLNETVDRITLEKLVSDYKKLLGGFPDMYYI